MLDDHPPLIGRLYRRLVPPALVRERMGRFTRARVKAAPLSMLIKVTGIWNTVHTAKVLRKRAERVKEDKLDTQDEAR